MGKTTWRYYLQEWRELRQLTQEELEAVAEVDQSTISAIETNPDGKRRPSTIRNLEKALNLKPGDLRRSPTDSDEPETRPAKPTLAEVLQGIEVLHEEGGLGPEDEDMLIEKIAIYKRLRRERNERNERNKS